MRLRRILLVDDDPDVRLIARTSLAAVGGFEVTEAESGLEALDRLEGWSPDAILLDVMMPELDGPATLARMREREALADVPVIFFTAKVQPREVDRYLDLGAAGVIPKPFDPLELADRLCDTVEAWRVARAAATP